MEYEIHQKKVWQKFSKLFVIFSLQSQQECVRILPYPFTKTTAFTKTTLNDDREIIFNSLFSIHIMLLLQ